MSQTDTAPERLRPVVAVLGWGGILPFLTLPLMAIRETSRQLETLFITYGLLILAFLCGTLWLRQFIQTDASIWRLIASNLILLAAWPAVLLPLPAATGLLAAGFLVHLVIDAPSQQTTLPAWYGRLRWQLSSVVATLLAMTALVGVIRDF